MPERYLPGAALSTRGWVNGARSRRLASRQDFEYRRTWGLSVKRHNGRWERTPFTGDVAELVDVMLTFMQHLVAS